MPLFTFYLDYRGGTYISQAYASTPELAPKIWAEQLQYKEVYGIGPKGKECLLKRIESEIPVPITGIKNTWCFGTLVNGAVAEIHFTETVESVIAS